MKISTRNFRNFALVSIAGWSLALMLQTQTSDYQKPWSTAGAASITGEAITSTREFDTPLYFAGFRSLKKPNVTKYC